MREFLRAKIHHARITKATLDYEGSLGIDADYLEMAKIEPFESVEIYNVTNGNRLRTYAIPMPRGSKAFESNGAAAHHIRAGDQVIIACFTQFTAEELTSFKGPEILILNDQNELKSRFRGERTLAPNHMSLPHNLESTSNS